MDEMVRLRRIAPEFVRKIENIGEKVWDMDKRLALSEQNMRKVLALGDSVIPMLDAAPLVAEDLIRIVGDISRGEDIRIGGFKKLIHKNAVLHTQARLGGQRRYRTHT